MCPLFGPFLFSIDQFVQATAIVWTQSGKWDEIVCWYQNVDEIDLYQACVTHQPSDVAYVRTRRSRPIEALRRKRDASCLIGRQTGTTHGQLIPQSEYQTNPTYS